jgi:hypothetical protein
MASLLLAAAMLGESSSSKSWALGSMADMVGVDCILLVFVLGLGENHYLSGGRWGGADLDVPAKTLDRYFPPKSDMVQ